MANNYPAIRKRVVSKTLYPGRRIGRLTVKRLIYKNRVLSLARCLCKCGTYKTIRTCSLSGKHPNTTSCGCLHLETLAKFGERNKKNFPLKVGRIYGHLKILKFFWENPTTRRVIRRAICRCSCGKIVERSAYLIRRGDTSSCGCFRRANTAKLKYNHGEARVGSETPEYTLWKNIKVRCFNKNTRSFADYGGRGITMYKPWIHDFPKFKNWLIRTIGLRPSKKYSIDRIDNDGNYTPGNLRWATIKQQRLNQRPPKYVIKKPRN